MAAQRGMDMRGIACKQHAPSTVSRRLLRPIRPGGGEPKDGHSDVTSQNAAQHRLYVLARDRLCSVEGTPSKSTIAIVRVASRYTCP